jgi:TRAP-type C4-dicarboxylate transport system permease small subunit
VAPDDVPANPPKRRRDMMMWIAFLGAPVFWSLHFQFIYSVSLWTHRTHVKWPLYASCIVTFVLCLICGYLAWRTHRSLYRPETAAPEAPEEDRVRMMAHLAWSGTLLFILGIGAQWVAIYMINPAVD